MRKLKRTKCLMPKCEKEVYDSNSKFCGEHKRAVIEARKFVASGTVAAIGIIVTAVRKKTN